MSLETFYRQHEEKVEIAKSSLESILQVLKDMEKKHAEFVSEFIAFDREKKSNFAELRRVIHSEITFNGGNPLKWEAENV